MPLALLRAVEMAFIYFVAHALTPFWPAPHQDDAVFYCFDFLHFPAADGGRGSLDHALRQR